MTVAQCGKTLMKEDTNNCNETVGKATVKNIQAFKVL